MENYFSAVRKMEQTVMFPSLLRGVSFEEQDSEFGESDADDSKDLYEHYTQLKSIKQAVEGGLVLLDGQQGSLSAQGKVQEVEEESDLERLFYHHTSALQCVLHQLTKRANNVTSRFNQIMQQISQNEITLRW